MRCESDAHSHESLGARPSVRCRVGHPSSRTLPRIRLTVRYTTHPAPIYPRSITFSRTSHGGYITPALFVPVLNTSMYATVPSPLPQPSARRLVVSLG